MSSIERMKENSTEEMQSEPKEKIDGILFLSKRIQFLRHELWQKEDKIDELQKHVLWLETELNPN